MSAVDAPKGFQVNHQESSIDITNSPDLLLCECFRFLGLLVQKRANFYYLSVREACDYLIVFPFISGFPEASDIALEMIVQLTQDFSNEKMELFSGEFRKLDKFHPIMDLALHGNEMAWGVIANLMNAGFLIKEFYEQNDFVDFINTVLTQTLEGIKTLESKEELDEEEIQEKDQMLAIHRLAMGVLASATYNRTAAKYGELYAQSNCLDVILEDILRSPIKIRKEACIALTHLLDFQGETIIHSLFEKNPEFPLEALRNLPALEENEQEAVINALTNLLEIVSKTGMMPTMDCIGGEEGTETIDDFLAECSTNLFAPMATLKNTIIGDESPEEE